MNRAGRNIGRSKGRTILTSLAIAVGSFTIMMSLAAGAGTREYSKNLIESNIDPQTLIAFKDKSLNQGNRVGSAPLQEYSDSRDARSGLDLVTQADIDALRDRNDVDWVEPFYQIAAKYTRFEGSETKYTMNISRYDSFIRNDVVAGNLPSKGTRIGENDIVLPEGFSDTLGLKPSELIGKKVIVTIESLPNQPSQEELTQLFMTGGAKAVEERMQGQTKDVTFVVRAVIRENGSSSLTGGNGSVVIDSSTAYEISEYTTKGTNDYRKYYTITVRARDGVSPVDLKQRLEKDNKIYAMTAEDVQQIIFQFVDVLQYIVTGFGVLALVASVFGIVNTQYISVLERTSQIGLMKALGMRSRKISQLFRYEAAWIGFFGGVIGVGLAWVATYFLNPWITSTLNLGEGNYLLEFEWLSAVELLIALIIIAVLAGWFPARKAAKLDPIEALRTE
ncbi:ABC transporter permease [Candidatus Saccharibacteria bacterium]|nr:ABC transporter permease [Candidatus Saccharibacteria bacterium]